MSKPKVYTFHPLSTKYPLMSEEIQALVVEDMKQNGFDKHFPIMLHEGLILAGRGRYLCSKKAKVDPVFKTLPKGTDPVEFVERENELRNHYEKEVLTKLRHARIERILARSANGETTRQIAAAEGVSQTQVQQDLEQGTSQGGNSHQDTNNGQTSWLNPPLAAQSELVPELADVKLSPKFISKIANLTKTKQKDLARLIKAGHAPNKAYEMVLDQREPGDESEATEEPRLPKDVANALADTWHIECARSLASMRKQVKTNINWSEWLDGEVIQVLKTAEEYFLAAIPKKVCDTCQGQKAVNKLKCTRCRGCGYLAAQA